MSYYRKGQMDLSDRIAIETGICSGESFKRIAKRIGRHPSTIAHEVKENRTYIQGNFFCGNDCRFARQCREKHVCGDEECDVYCVRCRETNCHRYCERYVSMECRKHEKSPYVCNLCSQKKLCNKGKYIYSAKYAEAAEVVEMDTVRGVRESGKRLLTMIFRKNNVMLLFLMPDGKAESVKRVFDYLEMGLGLEVFNRMFPVILTDNGSEFKKVDELEMTETFEYRTSLFYCEPMASWQKAQLEKNHEYIRYAIPKGKSLNPYNEEDITLLMNHINSTRRPGLGNKSPYELIEADNGDMRLLMDLLKMHLIPPDEVHLTPELFTKK